jgi:hypothetical protein
VQVHSVFGVDLVQKNPTLLLPDAAELNATGWERSLSEVVI